MADYRVRCECGKDTVLSEWALGAPLTCRACGRPLQATEKNTRPVEDPAPRRPARSIEDELPASPEARVAERAARRQSPRPARDPRASRASQAARPSVPGAPEESAAPARPLGKNHCDRCGRPFRGDWDRYHRAGQVVCHICANQYQTPQEESPEPAAPEPLPPPQSVYKGVLDQPILPDPEAPTARDVRETDELIRRWVIVAGVTCLVAVGFMLYTGVLDSNAPTPPPLTPDMMIEKAKELPKSAVYLTQAVLFVFRFATTIVALYILLRWRDKLPSAYFFASLLHIAVVAVFIQALGLGLLFVPCIGPLVHMFLAMYILWEVYDLELADFVMLAFFFFLLQPAVMVMRQFALGIIGLIYT
jgi:hypothetical protein